MFRKRPEDALRLLTGILTLTLVAGACQVSTTEGTITVTLDTTTSHVDVSAGDGLLVHGRVETTAGETIRRLDDEIERLDHPAGLELRHRHGRLSLLPRPDDRGIRMPR